MAYTPFFTNANIDNDERFLKSLYYEDQEKDIEEKFTIKENGDWILVHGEFMFPKINPRGILDEIIVSKFEKYYYPAVKKANSEQISTQFMHKDLDGEEDETKKRKIFYTDFNLTYDDFCLIIKDKNIQTSYVLNENGEFKSRGVIENNVILRVAVPTLVPSPKNGNLNGEVEFDGVIKSYSLSTLSNGTYESEDKRRIIRLESKGAIMGGDTVEILNYWYNGFGRSAKIYIAATINQILTQGNVTYKQQTKDLTEEQMDKFKEFIRDFNRNPSKYDVEEKLEE